MSDIAIAGAGAVALTMAAHFSQLGHRVHVWSPSGTGAAALKSGQKLRASGEVEGEFAIAVADSAEQLCASAELIFVAITANGQAEVLEAMAPHLRNGQTVLITGGPLAFGGLYLRSLLGADAQSVLIGGLNGPFTGGRKLGPAEVVMPWIRQVAKLVAFPLSDTPATIAAAGKVLGARFESGESALKLAMTPGNAIYHAALALGNITRMESGEEWCGYLHTTQSIGRLAEALDREKLAVAAAFDLHPPAIADALAGGDAGGQAVHEVMQPRTHQRTFRNGPRSVESRYIEEEVPFGLVAIELFGRIAGITTPITTSTIDLFGTMRGKDYRGMDTMLDRLGISRLGMEDARRLLDGSSTGKPSH